MNKKKYTMTFIKYSIIILSLLGTINSAFTADDNRPPKDSLLDDRSIKKFVKTEKEKRAHIIPRGFRSTHKLTPIDLYHILEKDLGSQRIIKDAPLIYARDFLKKETIYQYYSPSLYKADQIKFTDTISLVRSLEYSTPTKKTITLCYFTVTYAQDFKYAFMIKYFNKNDKLALSPAEKKDMDSFILELMKSWINEHSKTTSSSQADPIATPSPSENRHTRRRSRSIGGMDLSQLLTIQEKMTATSIKKPVTSPQASSSSEQAPVAVTKKSDSLDKQANLTASSPKRPTPLSLQNKGRAASYYIPPVDAISSARSVSPLPLSQLPSQDIPSTRSPREVKQMRTHARRQRSGTFDGTKPSPYSQLASPRTSPTFPKVIMDELRGRIDSDSITSSEEEAPTSK